MHIIVDFTVVPVGVGISLSPYIAACEKILAESGLTYELHANGTNVEGEWEEVFTAIRRCHETLHAMGVPRIHTDIKLGTRTDRAQTMADKIASVRGKMGEANNHGRE
ncbi:MAG: hypothetical protein FD146_814 [Anaerolineaceae bacterium]|nr:MAG: hypothetical protein FD146_814 [Anaerolineaceae bacterium]